jgi:hypothetical protein
MNDREWWRIVRHPYQQLGKTQDTHGQLKPTRLRIPPYHTFVVPFNWMLRSSQDVIDERTADQLPADEEPPFDSPWVFGSRRQEAVCDLFFKPVVPDESLVFFYTKSGQPVDDNATRLVVGAGRITALSSLLWYESSTKSSYPLWDRLIGHSIRPVGHDGFLLPYHDYLEATGDQCSTSPSSRR